MGLFDGKKGLFGGKPKQPKAPKQPKPPKQVKGAAPVSFTLPRGEPRAEGAARTMEVSSGPQFPRFQAMATDQLDRKRADRFGGTRMRLRNAFTPSQPVIDRQMFSGRSEVLTSMIRSIEDQRLHLVLYGERGIGKTSLLHVLAGAAREARYIVFYSSCGTASDFQETFRAAAEEIPVLFHSGFSPTNTDAERGSALASLLPPNGFSPRQFADVCAKLTGTRVLIFLDEFDRAASPDFRRDVSELMKFLSDRSVRVQLVIAGVAADLAELLEHTPSIRRNLLAVRVPLMNDVEVQGMVANGERASGLTFERPARDLVVAMAHGSPYLASLICHHAGLIAIDRGQLTVTATDAIGALDQALQEIEDRLARTAVNQIDRLMAEGAGPQLAAIAGVALRMGGEFNLSDLKTEMADSDYAECRQLVEKLAGESLVLQHVDDEYRKGYCFIEEGMRPYLWLLGARRQVDASNAAKAPRRATGA